MRKIKNYLSLIKFSHSIFALPFAIIGFVLGVKDYEFVGHGVASIEHHPYFLTNSLIKLVLVIVCMISARSAAMAFNRYLDRNIDAINPRTKIREIPAGIITPKNALLFTIVSCIVFLISCFFINNMALALAPVALFVILFYSYTKRFTALCHLVLGLGLSLAPIGAYIAVTAKFEILPILFSFVVLFWVSGFDIIYALQDEVFDKENQLHSIPAFMGKKNALTFSRLLHLACAALIIYIGYNFNFHLMYWIGALIFIIMLFYQQSIVSPSDLSKVNIAFMTSNGIASIVFAVFVITAIILNI
ncbi:MAG: putative 4-hydroxybenzoate polyprenyltransferase [Chitinophagaceae bacterium]|nr:putative 4-hydroxybenzoate polyprenyltransferase [Chitinophagaceae bacterium]